MNLMRYVVLAALLALSTPAHTVEISKGEWYSEDGTRLIFSGYDFKKWIGRAPDYWVDCRIFEWPISSPIARAVCLDGEYHNLEISMDGVVFDGVKLTQTFEAMD
jgi:hypothetical protein